MKRGRKPFAYHQLALTLRETILKGRLLPGEKLPGELVLARRHGLSRTTVRLAVKELEKDSLVYRRRGAGTFVSARPNPAPVTRSNFTDFLRGVGDRVSREVLARRWVKATPELARELELPNGSDLLWYHRLDRLDGQPMAFDYGWIYAPYARLIDKEDLAVLEFYEHWQAKQGIRTVKSVLEIAAEPATRDIAALLDIKKGAPVLLETASVFTDEHGAARFMTYYRHDMYRFKRTYYLEQNSRPR